MSTSSEPSASCIVRVRGVVGRSALTRAGTGLLRKGGQRGWGCPRHWRQGRGTATGCPGPRRRPGGEGRRQGGAKCAWGLLVVQQGRREAPPASSQRAAAPRLPAPPAKHHARNPHVLGLGGRPVKRVNWGSEGANWGSSVDPLPFHQPRRRGAGQAAGGRTAVVHAVLGRRGGAVEEGGGKTGMTARGLPGP